MKRSFSIIAAALLLTACGGGGGDPVSQSGPTDQPSWKVVEFARHVSENGLVRVHDRVEKPNGIALVSLSGWGEHHGYIGAWLQPKTGEPVDYLSAPSHSGFPSNSNPVEGGAVWTGLMAGRGTAPGQPNFAIIGEATLEVDFGTSTLDVLLHDIERFKTGGKLPDIGWNNVPMQDGWFRAEGLNGAFYGPGQEEAAGTFNKDGMTGAFGAKR